MFFQTSGDIWCTTVVKESKFLQNRSMAESNCTAPEEGLNVTAIPDYIFLFDVEKNFQYETWIIIGQTLHWLCVLFVAIYLLLLYFIKDIMKDLPGYELRKAQTIWNLTLSVFSAAASVRTIQELVFIVNNYGFKASYCTLNLQNPVAIFWSVLFLSSKAIELFDTLFVLLRKQKLMFLHWFHHSTVLIFGWYLALDYVAMGRWFMTMNCPIHAVMYAYYAARSARLRVPRFIAMSITVAQIVQMIVGFTISLKAFEAYFKGETCNITGRIVYISIALYSAYFALFLNFFFKTYIYPLLKKKLNKSQ